MFRLRAFLIAAAIAALTTSCGGGGSSATNSSSGMSTVMSTGVITGFGSIYVNGIHFQTTGALIVKNGQTVDQSQLAVGEVARIKGHANESDGQGDAEEVDVDEAVVGPISAIDKTNNDVTVLAQKVKINAGTSFGKGIQPADITGLTMGEVIRVDGMRDASGNIVAMRIDQGSSSDPLQVVGTVSGLDSTAHIFTIGSLIVDYSSASLDHFTSGGPSNGDTVEVQGTSFNSTSTTLTATEVRRLMTDQEEEGGEDMNVEREGLIANFTSATKFDVGGQAVTTTSSTMYTNGTASDLANNVKVEVEGQLNSSNVLVASVIRFEHNGAVELQANVTAPVNTTAGTLTLLGVQISVNSMTRFEDNSSAQVQMFSLSNVNVGDTIKVRGFENPVGSGMVVATSLEREPPTTTVIVQGPFTAGTSPQFMVLGITIDASSATITAGDEQTLTLAEFFTQAVGHSVKVEGTLSGTMVAASRIRIDDETGDED